MVAHAFYPGTREQQQVISEFEASLGGPGQI